MAKMRDVSNMSVLFYVKLKLDKIYTIRFPTKNGMFTFTREDYLNVPIIKTVYLRGGKGNG